MLKKLIPVAMIATIIAIPTANAEDTVNNNSSVTKVGSTTDKATKTASKEAARKAFEDKLAAYKVEFEKFVQSKKALAEKFKSDRLAAENARKLAVEAAKNSQTKKDDLKKAADQYKATLSSLKKAYEDAEKALTKPVKPTR